MRSLNKKTVSTLGLIFVVLLWGVAPLITREQYAHYSATLRVSATQLISIVFYLIVAGKRVRELSWQYVKIAAPLGFFYGLADLLQKIGLQYTTPAKYAFLENLSCIAVPFLSYWFLRKRPTAAKLIACLICLLGAYVLNTAGNPVEGSSLGIGEILCALAGIFYGVNIAGTGAFAKNLYAPLYLLIQSCVSGLLSLGTALVFNAVPFRQADGNFSVLEPIKFSFRWDHLLVLIAATVIISGFGWIIRTNCMKHVDATVVAVIMPFSAVITGVASVLIGYDKPTVGLILGGILGVIAIILSELGDREKPKAKPRPTIPAPETAERTATTVHR